MIESPDCLLKIIQPRPVSAQQYKVYNPALTFNFPEFDRIPKCSGTHSNFDYIHEVQFEGTTLTNSADFVKFDPLSKSFTVSTNYFNLIGKYTIVVSPVNIKVVDVKVYPLLIDLDIIDPCIETKFELDDTFLDLFQVPEG